MRVRVLRDFTVDGKLYRVGESVELDPKLAKPRLRTGHVMKDKSLDGPDETK